MHNYLACKHLRNLKIVVNLDTYMYILSALLENSNYNSFQSYHSKREGKE